MSLPFNIRADLTYSRPTCTSFFNSLCHLQKLISPQPWGSTWCATYHRKQHDVYYPSMGLVYTCAFSFMSKYLHQSCGPKSMTRVDINDNNQYSNNLPLCHWWKKSFSPCHHDPNLSPPLKTISKGGVSPLEFNDIRWPSLGLLPLNMWHSIILHPYFFVFGTFYSLESFSVASIFSLFFMSRMYMLFSLLVAIETNFLSYFLWFYIFGNQT